MELKSNNNLWELEVSYLTLEEDKLVIRKKTFIIGIDERNPQIKQENTEMKGGENE